MGLIIRAFAGEAESGIPLAGIFPVSVGRCGLVVAPRPDRYFSYGQQDAKGSQKALCALPVLLMLLHAVLKVGDAAAVAVAHESGHLRFEHA
jgi:hypothetical protein